MDGYLILGYPYVAMTQRMSLADVRPVSRLFKALGDETRLRIVGLLAHRELCVCHLQEALGVSQPTVSRHLGILRSAGVVESRRDGSWIHYGLAHQDDPECERQLRAVARSFARDQALRRDIDRLLKSRGPGACR